MKEQMRSLLETQSLACPKGGMRDLGDFSQKIIFLPLFKNFWSKKISLAISQKCSF